MPNGERPYGTCAGAGFAIPSCVLTSVSDQEQAMNSAESPGPVVVGVDGSDAAVGAAEWAAKDAIHQDVALRLVYVIETTDGPSASRSDYPADDQYAERSLHAARLAVEATGVPV